MDQKQQEQRRLFTFSITFMVLWLGWFVAGPILFPGLFPQKQPEEVAKAPGESDPDNDGDDAKVQSAEPGKEGEKPAAPAKPQLEEHLTKTVTLGSIDPQTGYGMKVTLTSVGASIQSALLNEDRYQNADRKYRKGPRPPLQLVGNNLAADAELSPLDRDRKPLTFDLSIERVDKQLKKIDRAASLKTVNWKVENLETDADNKDIYTSASFVARSPDGKLEITKSYRLNRIAKDKLAVAGVRDSDAAPYTLDVSVSFKNLTEKDDAEVVYTLQGPVGLPLENPDVARKYRDIKAGFLNDNGSVTAQTVTATEIVKAIDKGAVEDWTKPISYLGIDLQYFAALVVPGEPQLEKPYFARSRGVLVDKGTKKEHSDISVELTSKPLEVSAGKKVEHRLKLYLGPKREELLGTYEATGVFDYGWFGAISHLLVRLMRAFHSWGAPYGLAIVMLTVIVRCMLFPLSKKQAMSGKKMKDLQPLLNEIREKYKDDKQALATAQMELYRKANFNPFGGCLLVFLQLPIFISLYQAISNCIDLRLAVLLYIGDLSAPDAMFEFPFPLPWLGPDFNLLPLITMVLYYLQQKLFMPPPANEEAAMQMKMMNYMMIFFGFLFYHVPAGLCVYFIASSLWSMAERKVIEYLPDPPPPAPEQQLYDAQGKPIGPKPKEPGFLGKLFKQLQEAAELQQQLQKEEKHKRDKK